MVRTVKVHLPFSRRARSQSHSITRRGLLATGRQWGYCLVPFSKTSLRPVPLFLLEEYRVGTAAEQSPRPHPSHLPLPASRPPATTTQRDAHTQTHAHTPPLIEKPYQSINQSRPLSISWFSAALAHACVHTHIHTHTHRVHLHLIAEHAVLLNTRVSECVATWAIHKLCPSVRFIRMYAHTHYIINYVPMHARARACVCV